jgi:hypothetical protein
MAGVTLSFGAGEGDAWVLKLGPDGAVEWQKAYGGIKNDKAHSIHQTTDRGYVVAGDTSSFITKKGEIVNLWVFKLGPDGTVEWQKTYGWGDWDMARSIQQTSDGGYIVVGETRSFDTGEEDFWVLKLRSDGTVEWQKTYGGGDKDEAYCVKQTADGGYIVTGATKSYGTGGYDIWVLKLRGNGAVEWQKTYGGVEDDGAFSIQQTSDSGYIVACEGGSGKGFRDAGGDLPDILILKLRPDGTLEWQKSYGGIGWDGAVSVQQTNDGGYIVGGWAGSPVSRRKETEGFEADLLVLKLGADGSVEWQRTYGGIVWDSAHSIQQTTDGGYIAAGVTDSFTPVRRGNIWVLKLDDKGLIAPSCEFIRNTPLSRKDRNITVKTSSAIVRDSRACSRDSSATVQATDATTNILCK